MQELERADVRAEGDLRFRDSLLREDLSSFIAKAFHTVNPQSEYLPNWHIDLLAEELTACAEGKVRRLIINMPPRMLKSLSVSVAWPAWLLGKDPSRRVIAASYSRALAEKHALDCRLVVNSSWFRRIFRSFALAQGQREKHKFVTTQNGFRLAASVGGTLTGEGGQFLIVDDPLNPRQAMSKRLRQSANDWFDQTFASRLDDPTEGVIIIVMHRLHPNDLIGHLLEKEGSIWRQLVLPAQMTRECVFDVGGRRIAKPEGSYLMEARLGPPELERLKMDLGSSAYAAQYLQVPSVSEGLVFQRSWFGRYMKSRELEACTRDAKQIVQSWDTAVKAGENSDFSVCTSWGVMSDGRFVLLDVFRARMEYPALKRKVLAFAEQMKPHALLIEDKASGQQLSQELRMHGSLPIIPIVPKQDKLLRAYGISALIEGGRVWLPEEAHWLLEFETEVFGFPLTPHDDQVDSMVQFLQWIKQRDVVRPGIRSI